MPEPLTFQDALPNKNTLTFHLDEGRTEVLKITPDGFFVRGAQVPQGEGEAKAVYDAFCDWLQASTCNLP